MSLLYDESQQAIATEAERVVSVKDTWDHLLKLIEGTGKFDEDFWNVCIEQGWTGITIPEEYDGLGLSLVELGIIAENIGTMAGGVPFITSSYGLSQGLVNYGTDALKSEILPKIAIGELIGTFAFSEGQDVLPKASRLKVSNGRLNGSKPSVLSGLKADVALVLASDENGPVLAVVKLNDNGVEKAAIDSYDNSRLYSDLNFKDSECSVLVSGQAALDAAKQILAEVAVVVAHEQMGGAKKMMTKARDYALERRAFGQPIGKFQSVKHRIAELYAHVELSRANAIHAASRHGQPDFILAAAAARLQASEGYDTATRDSVQVHGGIGTTWEGGLHLHMRRTRSLANELGNSLYWEDVLVDELLEQK